MHHQRGDSVCRNGLLVRRDELEESLLRGLSESVLRTEVIDYAVARMEEALRKRFEELDAELEQLRQQKHQIEAEIARVIQAIADGEGSKSITAAIGDRERALRGIADKLLEPRPGSLRSTWTS
jgi:septal ring factor EnvC (AmiA/AmiB activator)